MARYPQAGELANGPDRFYCFEQGDPHYFERTLRQELYKRTRQGMDNPETVRKEMIAAWEYTAEHLWELCQEYSTPEPVIWAA